MHFEFTVTLGQVISVLTIIMVGQRLQTKFDRLFLQNDMMWIDYCHRKGLTSQKVKSAKAGE